MVSSTLGLGQFPAGRAGWEPQPMGTVMDRVACSGTFHVLFPQAPPGLSKLLPLWILSSIQLGTG